MEIVYNPGTGLITAWGDGDMSGHTPPGHSMINRPGFKPKSGKSINDYIVKDEGGGDDVFLKDYLELSVDAIDTITPHDDVPDIPADGVATTLVTIQKMDGESETPLTGAGDNDSVYIGTTGGKLSAQSVTLANGVATVNLTSSNNTVLVTVGAWNPQGILRGGETQVQFRA